MVGRQIDDGVFVRRKYFVDLSLPEIPGVAAPEIIGPEESALEQVLAQRGNFRVVE